MEMFDLTGRKAIVTGGGGSLGKGAVEALLQYGAACVIVDISEKTRELADEFTKAGYEYYAVIGDISSRQSVEKVFEQAVEKLGGTVDILVNAAGICRRCLCEDFTMEDWDDVININLTATFSFSQLAARIMMKNKYGKIINFASLLSFFGGHSVPSYAASKGGVSQLTKSLANDWTAYGINVNAIAPGYMDTPLNVGLMQDAERYQSITARIPAGRWGTADDLKGVIVFLASHASDYVAGTTIPIDGGYMGG